MKQRALPWHLPHLPHLRCWFACLARVAAAAATTLAMTGGLARAEDAKASAPRAFDPNGEDWQGLGQLVHLAREVLGPGRVVVSPVLPLAQLERDDALFIVHPTASLDVDEIETFLRAGGRVVLLDDYGTGDELLERFHVLRVPMPERPAQMLRGNPSLSIAEPLGNHPILHGVAHVVTNHATGVEQAALQRLLVVHGDGEPDVGLALAGVVGKGRFVAVGDGSVVINTMMRFPGNRALAEGLIQYAAGGEGPSERHGKLYVLANHFQTSGSYGDESTLASAAGDGRRLVFGAFESLRREGMPPPVALVLSLLVALGIVGWTTLRASRTYRPTVLRFVRPIPVSVQGGVAGRAAALGLPNSPVAEAVLEFKRALEESLAARLPGHLASPGGSLVDNVRQLGILGPDEMGELGRLLWDLRRLEEVVVGTDPRRVRSSQVIDLAARVQAMLRSLRSLPEARPYRVPSAAAQAPIGQAGSVVR